MARKQTKQPKGPPPAMSPLFEAIRQRDETKVHELLTTGGLDLSARDEHGRTPFQSARYQRSDEIALMLLDADAPIEKQDLNLYWAVSTRRADVVKKFIDAGANVEMQAVGGTPLELAASRDLPETVQLLIDAGADINADSGIFGTALAHAIENNSGAAALVLIRAGAKVDPPKYSDSTLLISAIGYGNREVALALIEAGADVNQRGKTHYLGGELDRNSDLAGHATPLILATRVGDEAIVEALLAGCADVHARDKNGKRALDWAKAAGHAGIVARLKAAAKATPAKVDLDEDLIFAVDQDDLANARDLLARGANPDARDTRPSTAGFTPLMLAARRGDVAMATLLLDTGAAIEARDNDGQPPDPKALKTLKCMINEGADEYIAELGLRLGRTPLHLAVEAEQERMVRLLLERGADPNGADALDRTPAMLAREAGFKELLEMLQRAGGSAPNEASVPPAPKLKAPPKSKSRRAKKKSKPKKAPPPLPEPDFSAAAKTPAFEKALAEMEKICGSKRQPINGLAGVFTFHVHSSKAKGIDLRKIHEDFLRRGFYAFSTDATKDTQLALAPTTDMYALIAAFQTNGANYDLGPAEIAQWLRELEDEVPFRLTGIGWDFLKGYFTAHRPDPHDLAERMYQFCPDIVDQGIGDVDALAESLAEKDDLFFWWD